MAVNKSDIYQHANPNYAFVDSEFVRGGGRVVANLTELYALTNKIDQLKERVTKVYVISEEITYVLVNKLDITAGVFNSTAWEEESGGMSTVYTDGTTITGDGSEESPLIANIEVIESETPPLNPIQGLRWFNLTNGVEYTYLQGYWVDLNGGTTLQIAHSATTGKNSEAAFQHVDTTAVKTTLVEDDKVALYDSETGKMVLSSILGDINTALETILSIEV